MKKLFWQSTTTICVLILLTLTIHAQSFGIIGSVLTTDIRAYINGYEIPAYNVDGNMVIIGSDLRNYGFNVVYDNSTRTSKVSYSSGNGNFDPIINTSSNYNSVGTKIMDVYDTDIIVVVNGTPVTSYNVDGQMAFRFSELQIYGTYYYDNEARSTNLWIDENNLPTEGIYIPQNSDTGITQTTGIRPGFKEALDSYEKFFDEYTAFMENYQNTDNPLLWLDDYTQMIMQYTETMQKLSDMDDGNMTTEEALYYLEVNTRIMKKVAAVAQ